MRRLSAGQVRMIFLHVDSFPFDGKLLYRPVGMAAVTRRVRRPTASDEAHWLTRARDRARDNRCAGQSKTRPSSNVKVILTAFGNIPFSKHSFIFLVTSMQCKYFIISSRTNGNNILYMRFQVPTASIKMAVFWDFGPCSLVDTDERFRETCCPQHQGATSQMRDIFSNLLCMLYRNVFL
jgi:hypothetical protein